MIKDQTALPEGSNARSPHPSRLTQNLRLHGLSPHSPTTTLRERRERERSAPVHLRRTAHALRWRGRRRANRLVGPPMLFGVQLLLSLLLLLWVLFSVGGYEGILFGEAGGDFVVVLLSSPAISIPSSCSECEIWFGVINKNIIGDLRRYRQI